VVTLYGASRVEGVPDQQPQQCVPYAREHSAIKIYGDAWTWWEKASSKYERGQVPASGAVMVLTNYAGPNHAHVAVVKRIVSLREIRIDHANWLNDGSIYVNNPVMDVSLANDWSQVRVFNIQTGGWGSKVYQVQGFIYADSDNALVLQDLPKASKPASSALPLQRPPKDDAQEGKSAPDNDSQITQILLDKHKAVIAAEVSFDLKVPLMPVSAGSVLNPPAGSPFALTSVDLAIP
jgi:surface antigen